MLDSTSITYQLKREISRHLPKPEKKFSADMTYGMLAAKSCLLTDIVDQLHEDSRKVNSVERLTREKYFCRIFSETPIYRFCVKKVIILKYSVFWKFFFSSAPPENFSLSVHIAVCGNDRIFFH